ncbi:hypothetical protein PV08_02320 [Exophiala spinifera]|uniref:BZIP domain-containing protein n=1 Tax=Exophiala spinifera TaxID=91928 RepID=A0A0D2BGE3_9EURO|nr:uncharacterized protein PV08_02320 [Exophiala spinifera]KIW18033.1 hypothetical protein PV08_02320 [Exophiala spinifera]
MVASSAAIATKDSAGSPAKYKRKLTEARREQNRRSQRLWRDKQKQRREEEITTKVQEELERLKPRLKAPSAQAEGRPSSSAAGHNSILCSGVSQPCEVLDHTQPSWNTHSPLSDEEIRLPDPVLPLPTALYYFLPPDPEAVDMRCFWGCPEGTEHNLYQPPQPPSRRSGVSAGEPPPTISPYSIPTLLSSWSASPPAQVSRTTARSSFFPPGSHLPSPYLNHLQLVGESCFAATLSIATGLGISRASYVNDHPSPFSSSSTANIHTIPADLRPTAIQIMLPHPCYLDCIPFPHFRSMAVYLSSLNRLDHCSLFLDIMHDGMVCWGRHGANARYGRSMRDSVPWSKRSWEVKPWFLRKWAWIAKADVPAIDSGAALPGDEFDYNGDDEDGMISGSQWWWSLHGEKEDQFDLARNAESPAMQQQEQHEELGSYLSRIMTCNVAIRQTSEKHLLRRWDGVHDDSYYMDPFGND